MGFKYKAWRSQAISKHEARIATAVFVLSLITGCGGGGNVSLTTVPTAHLAISLPGTTTVATTPYTFTVSALDANNAVVPSYVGTVRITASDTSAALPANATLSQGSRTFTVTFNGVGSQTITASDTLGNATAGTSQVIAVSAIQTPTVASDSPSFVQIGGPAFTLTVNGSNFVPGSIIRLNGMDLSTKYVSGSQLTAQISTNEVSAPLTGTITVFNPAPGGGNSNPLDFDVSDELPLAYQDLGISPACLPAGEQGFDLLVAGFGFRTDSVVRWNGSDRPTTFVSITRLIARISASDVASAGWATITVSSLPALGSRPFLITNSGAQPFGIAIAPNDRFAYVLNLGCPVDGTDYFGDGITWFNSEDFGSAGYVTTFALDPVTGLLTRMGPRTITHDTSPIVLNQMGGFVYVGSHGFVQTCSALPPYRCSDGDNPSTSVYSLDAATGALTFTGEMDWDCSQFGDFCNEDERTIDPTGKFAYVWDTSEDLEIDSVDGATGELVPTGQKLIGVGFGPLFFGPTGSKWVYIRHDTDTPIYSFDPMTGALTAAGTTTAVPSRLTFDPTGKLGYASSTDTVQIFRVDPATGALTLIGTVGT